MTADRGACAGRTYLERGAAVRVERGWRQHPGVPFPGVLTRPHAPRNVLVVRTDGSAVVRPFRGLRRPA